MNKTSSPIQGYHTWWGAKADQFEIVTHIASAAAWSRHYGKLDLYVDSDSAKKIFDLKLEWMYNNIYILPVRNDILLTRCWAWPKLEAMRLASEKSSVICSVDLDCVVWNPLNLTFGVTFQALHYDCGQWKIYHELRPVMQLLTPTLNWDVQPVNAGILLFNDPEFVSAYYTLAEKMAVFISGMNDIKLSKDAGAVTIEQLLPVVMALSEGKRIDVFETISNISTWRHDPDHIMHLWGTKRIYRSDKSSRNSLISHLIAKVEEFDQVAANAMKKLG